MQPQLSISQINALLGVFQHRYQNIPVTAVRIILELAEAHFAFLANDYDESQYPTIGELSVRLRIPQPTVSRLVKMLGQGDGKLKPEGGLNLVETLRDKENGKPIKRVCLSENGRSLIYGLSFHPTLER